MSASDNSTKNEDNLSAMKGIFGMGLIGAVLHLTLIYIFVL